MRNECLRVSASGCSFILEIPTEYLINYPKQKTEAKIHNNKDCMSPEK